MPTRSILAVISNAMASVGLRAWKETCQYERALLALARAEPDLTRSAAARIVNAQLEIADGAGASRNRSLVASPILASHDIRVREVAYLMWEAAGKLTGCDEDFWLMAERWVVSDAAIAAEPIRMRDLTSPLTEELG